MLTICPEFLFQHLGGGALRDVKEARDIDADIVGVVLGGELGEGLGKEDAGIVDQRVDASKTLQAFADDALGGFGQADVAWHGEDIGVCSGFDRTGTGDNAIVPIAIGPNQARANPLGGAGDDYDLLFGTHDVNLFRIAAVAKWRPPTPSALVLSI